MKADQLRRLLPAEIARGTVLVTNYTRIQPGRSSVSLQLGALGFSCSTPSDEPTMLLSSINACGRLLDRYIRAAGSFEHTWQTDKEIKFLDVSEKDGVPAKLLSAKYDGHTVLVTRREGVKEEDLKLQCILELAVKLQFME